MTDNKQSTAGGARAVPEGWRLVPVEPTPEMCVELFGVGNILRGRWQNALAAAPSAPVPVEEAGSSAHYGLGQPVRKRTGSSWRGRVVGTYSTSLTPRGYCVESDHEPGSVQIYPEAALEPAGATLAQPPAPAPAVGDTTGAKIVRALDDIIAGNVEEVFPTSSAPAARETFQARVDSWVVACFGYWVARDVLERQDRFVEEALELVQSLGYDRRRVAALTDYVFGREPGEPRQEIGGTLMTLAALCNAIGRDMHAAGEAELARVWTKVEKIRAKQAAKPKGSALPIAVKDPAPAVGEIEGLVRVFGSANRVYADARHLRSREGSLIAEKIAEAELDAAESALLSAIAHFRADRDALMMRSKSIENQIDELIGERDNAEDAMSQAYYLMVGRSPECSSLFGYKRALEDIDEAQRVLRLAAQCNTAADRDALAGGEAWQPIETAPHGQEIEVKVGSMLFLARLVRHASTGSDGKACDQWQATREGEHPPSWSEGACWENNADEALSLQPTHWRSPPATPARLDTTRTSPPISALRQAALAVAYDFSAFLTEVDDGAITWAATPSVARVRDLFPDAGLPEAGDASEAVRARAEAELAPVLEIHRAKLARPDTTRQTEGGV